MSITPDAETVVIYSCRQAHGKDEIKSTMTVGELIAFLKWLNPDANVYVEGYDGHLCNGLAVWDTIDGGE